MAYQSTGNGKNRPSSCRTTARSHMRRHQWTVLLPILLLGFLTVGARPATAATVDCTGSGCNLLSLDGFLWQSVNYASTGSGVIKSVLIDDNTCNNKNPEDGHN